MSAPPDLSTLSRIGIDESGKGDYFGPLVIAAVFVTPVTQQDLVLMQVRDSKKISDGRILEMAPDIRLVCPHSIVAIGPQRYNELYAKIRNLNRLLAWGHARALENLLQQVDCDLAIADQFGDRAIDPECAPREGQADRISTTDEGRNRCGRGRRLDPGPRRISSASAETLSES